MKRKKLPARRASEIIELKHILSNGNEQLYFADIGRYKDNTIGEIFLDMERQSNEVANLARDASLILSIAIQYGVPVDKMRASVGRSETGLPHSVIGTALDLLERERGNNDE